MALPRTATTYPPAPARPDTGPDDRAVAIVGGSLVGPAAELFLRRRGLHHVATYETLPTARSQSGGVMGLRHDTIALLAELGVDIDAIEALDDRHVYAYDLTDDGPVPRNASAFPGVVTSWDALHTQLRRLVDVRTQHRLTAVDEVDGRWRLRFAGRPDTFADVVVFADGRHSTGRRLLDPGRALRYTGYIVWRGLTAAPDPLPHGFERYYDIDHGRLFSLTAPLRQSGRCYWEFSHNLPAHVYTDIAGAGPTERAFLLPQHVTAAARAVIAGAARHLPDRFTTLIRQSEVAGIPVNDTTMPTRAVFGGRASAVLLGDALLPVRLQVGAGLNQGLHQAAELADALTTPHGAALPGWEHRTLERLAPWAELGRSRAHRNNLGAYEPVRPGRTAIPCDDQWSPPMWVNA